MIISSCLSWKIDDMVVLQGLAQSASEFRNIMKEIGVTKAGQREKILQAVLAA